MSSVAVVDSVAAERGAAAARPPEAVGGAGQGKAGLYGKSLALPRWRVHAARVMSLVTLGAGAYYLAWRPSTLDGTGALGVAFYAAEVVNLVFLALTVVVYWSPAFRRPTSAAPFGTLDVFLPVCGEPVELFEKTLQAALAIRYPHNTYVLNDGLAAGKDNWRDVERLAASYGVPCFTRSSGAKGKAANMNEALAQTSGDFVITIDSDHRAHPELADQTLGYFRDPEVGLVCSPQEFDTDSADLLNNQALLFHRYVQCARDSTDSAQSCGNATVYRRAALDEIGGFSEWVSVCEDLHSTYRMHARSWKSAYHNNALTRGLAPQTASAFTKQQVRWATDSLRLLFWDNPFTKRGLSLRQRALYVQNTGYYLVGSAQLLFAMSSALWLLLQVPVMTPETSQEYLVHSVPFLASITILLMLWGGLRGGVRSLYTNVCMAPAFMIATVRALTGVRLPPQVTEKINLSKFSPLVWPQFLLFGFLVAALVYAFLNPAPGQAIAAFWAGFSAFALTGFVTAVSENGRVRRTLRVCARTVVVLLAAAIVLPITARTGGDAAAGGSTFPDWEGSRQPLQAPSHGAYLGSFDGNAPSVGGSTATLEDRVAGRGAIVSWHEPWLGADAGFRRDWAEAVAAEGGVPLVVWEPWAGSAETVAAPAAIAAGRYDAIIREFAQDVAAFGRPVLLAPLHEPNGSWYPWSTELERNSPAAYRAAWRRVHRLFREEGAANAAFVWAVYSLSAVGQKRAAITEAYPGARFVDWTAIAALNFGTAGSHDSWSSAEALLRSTYDALRPYSKPVLILELGTTAAGGDAAVWVRDALTTVRTSYPQVKGLVWYDDLLSKDVDLRLRGSALDALRAEASRPYWRATPRTVTAG